MDDQDLPDPTSRPRPKFSDLELSQHFGKILRTATTLSLAYAGVHKVLIPISLGFLKVANQSYSRLDFTIIFGVLFWFCLRSENSSWSQKFLGLSAGIVLGDGLWEAYQIVTGQVEGWLQISRALSTFPLALMGIWALVRISKVRAILEAWAGGILLWIFFLLAAPFFESSQNETPFNNEPEASLNLESEVHPQEIFETDLAKACGVAQLGLDLSAPSIEVIDTRLRVQVRDCGFQPSVLQVSKAEEFRVEFDSEMRSSVNLHFLVFDSATQTVKKSINFVLPKNQKKFRGPKVSLNQGDLAILFSDGFEKLGIVGFLRDDFKKNNFDSGKIVFSRKPPRVLFTKKNPSE